MVVSRQTYLSETTHLALILCGQKTLMMVEWEVIILATIQCGVRDCYKNYFSIKLLAEGVRAGESVET